MTNSVNQPYFEYYTLLKSTLQYRKAFRKCKELQNRDVFRHSESMKYFGQQLTAHLDKIGMTMYRLSKLSQMSESRINNVVNGRRNPKSDFIQSLVAVDELGLDEATLNLWAAANNSDEVQGLISTLNNATEFADAAQKIVGKRKVVKVGDLKRAEAALLNSEPLESNVHFLGPVTESIQIRGTVAAGSISFAEEADLGEVPIPPGFKYTDETLALQVSGDSMEDAYHHGDIIIVKPVDKFTVGEKVVVQTIDAETCFKLVKSLTDDSVELAPLNKKRKSVHVPLDHIEKIWQIAAAYKLDR